MVLIKKLSEIEKIKKSNEIVAEVLRELKSLIKPGVNTLYLNKVAEKIAKRKGATPGFKGYGGFPFSLCASINNIVIHGFPSETPLVDGDIVSLDFGILLDGYYGDAAITVPVGTVDRDKERLVKATEESLYKGIEQALPGNRLADIAYAIQSCVEEHGFSVVRNYGGHGIGRKLHEEPHISNYWKTTEDLMLKSGMTLAIEPIVVEGRHEVKILPNRWEVATTDNKMAAHFEHSIAITSRGPIILSK